jgi:hypothetical protein
MGVCKASFNLRLDAEGLNKKRTSLKIETEARWWRASQPCWQALELVRLWKPEILAACPTAIKRAFYRSFLSSASIALADRSVSPMVASTVLHGNAVSSVGLPEAGHR